ncbi:hypothetical protein SDC9_197691 [bioreactor metagenome]|uniref:HTH cro/C1-type domain-containing protein n=1 Tax=bioreactor metagenome TaxID=1076179 RepID=A0A645IFJ8_9ZZZZ
MNNIKELRKLKKLSQSSLAKIMNVDQTAVSKWELDKAYPDMELAMKLADFFDVSVDYLLGRTDEKSPGKEPELDKIDYAFMGEYKELSNQDKQTIREMARLLKERGKK